MQALAVLSRSHGPLSSLVSVPVLLPPLSWTVVTWSPYPPGWPGRPCQCTLVCVFPVSTSCLWHRSHKLLKAWNSVLLA